MAELDEFDKALGVLCAGFNVPCTEERRAAYRKAFGQFEGLAWERLIGHCLSERGPERMPSVSQLWGIRAEMRARAPTQPKDSAPEWPGGAWALAANRHLLAHLVRKAVAKGWQCTPMMLRGYLDAKNAWADDMRDLAKGSDAVPPELQRSIWRDYLAKAEAAMA